MVLNKINYFLYIISLLMAAASAAKCPTCRDDECAQEIPLVDCASNNNYGCLDLKYYDDESGTSRRLQQCVDPMDPCEVFRDILFESLLDSTTTTDTTSTTDATTTEVLVSTTTTETPEVSTSETTSSEVPSTVETTSILLVADDYKDSANGATGRRGLLSLVLVSILYN